MKRRTQWDVIRTCWYPELRLSRSYEVESTDGIDMAKGWMLEIEWLGLYLSIAGGLFRPGKGL